ncbi:unnamed protein product [Penicillium salamii]|uniref:Carrier domain-containing protein n=1 Tax=Penicillium salamii TaxID=1612424 RepID=A0A9W4I422_9EURO|nr:unnamed protein product [Penicillium salamii]
MDTIEFWQSDLYGFDSLDFPPPADTTRDGLHPYVCEQSIPLSPSLGSDGDAATYIYAAWALLLGKYNMSRDIVIGAHSVPEAKTSTKLLPLRVQWALDTSISELLKTVRQKSNLLLRHASLQLSEIQSIGGDAMRACRFHSSVAVASRVVDAGHAKSDSVAVRVVLDPNGANLHLSSFSLRVGQTQLSTLAEQLVHTIQQLCNSSIHHIKIQDMDFVSPSDRTKILELNQVAVATFEAVVQDQFMNWVLNTPDAAAICSWDGSLTYRDLNELSLRLAGYLTRLGVQSGEMIPICFEKSKWAVVSMLAVLRSGGACVNISANHPYDRRKHILELCNTKLGLVSDLHASKFHKIGTQFFVVNEEFIRAQPLCTMDSLPCVTPDDIAYVLFTSGSTGMPKGIVIEHGSLCTSSKTHGDKWNMNAGTRVLQFASFSFDVSVADIFFSLMRGACICMPSEEDRINSLAATAAQMKVEWASLTPSVADFLTPREVPTLKTLILGGEASKQKNLSTWAESASLIVCTGPAETTIYCMGSEPKTTTSNPANVGSGIGGRIWIGDVDNSEQLAPIGCPGELLIEGRIVAREYLKDPERTKKSFLVEPNWLPNESPPRLRRVFKTGDLVRYDADGTVCFIGRRDTQVKIAGQRVELGEIEKNVLLRSPGLKRATAFANPPSEQNQRHKLILFLEFKDSALDAPTVEPVHNARAAELKEIYEALRLSVPPYMVPSLYVPLGAIPLTLNGKVDRRKLQELYSDLSDTELAGFALADTNAIHLNSGATNPAVNEIPSAGGPLVLVQSEPTATKDISLQSWPPSSSACSGSYQLLQRLEPRVVSFKNSAVGISAVIEAAFALLLSEFCKSQAVGFGLIVPQSSEIGQGSCPTIVVVDVDQEVALGHFLSKRDAHLNMMRQRHISGNEELHQLDQAYIGYGDDGIAPSTLLSLQSASTSSASELLDLAKRFHIKLLTHCSMDKNTFTLSAIYDQGVMSSTEISRFLSQFESLVESMCDADSNCCLQDIPLVGSQEAKEILKLAGPPCSSVDDVIFDKFRQAAQLRSHKTAIEAWDGIMSYADLLSYSESLAVKLHRLGVTRGDMVPICMQKSCLYPVAILAVLRLGAAFVPLDPVNPIARLKAVTDQINAQVILTSPATEDLWLPVVRTVVALDSPFEQHVLSCEDLPPIWTAPESIAYIIFTSGSTGTPKGVQVEHQNYLSGAVARASHIHRNENSRVFQFSSHAFDTSVEDILTTLLVGGTICIPSNTERQTDVEGAITRYKANVADLTPALVNTLSPARVPTLETLILGGEVITGAIVKTWASHVALINTYGPSECAIVGTVTNPLTVHSNYLDIGQGCACRTWIVDLQQGNRLVPIGVPGELILEGPIVGHGYLNEPIKTAAVFKKNMPWSNLDSRFYKTGDVVRLTERGELEFLHRKDTMIKLNGQRVELADIELHVLACFHTTDLAVEVISDGEISYLVLFFRSNEDTLLGSRDGVQRLSPEHVKLCQELKKRLADVLPSYMIPGTFVPLNEMPRTVSAKLDRARLRNIAQGLGEKDLNHYRLANDFELPSTANLELTEIERKVRSIWSKVLKVSEDSLRSDSDFIAVGGDSIRAMRLASSLKRAKFPISVPDIFRNPVLCEMAAKICCKTVPSIEEEFDPAPLSLVANPVSIREGCVQKGLCSSVDDIDDILPCTQFQESVMLASSMQPGAYSMRSIWNLKAGTDVNRLRAAWDTAVAAYPILRSIIIFSRGQESLQIVMKKVSIWRNGDSFHDYVQADESDYMGYATPLLRLCVIKATANQPACLIMTIHHALYDEASLEKILKEVNTLYERPKYRIAKSPSFSRFVRHLTTVDWNKSREFWENQMHGTPATKVLEANVSLTVATRSEKMIHRVLDIPLSLGLAEAPAATTLAIQVRAAWSLAMSCFARSEDIVFGATSMGRNVPLDGILDMVGPTMTTFPVRVQVNKNISVQDFLQQLQKQATDVIAHEHFGMQKISQINAAACDYQTILVVKTEDLPAGEEEDTSSVLINPDFTSSGKGFYLDKLILEVHISKKQISFFMTFDDSTISEWLLRSVLDTMAHFLHQLLSCDPTLKVRDLDYCNPEHAEKVESWNSKPFAMDHRMVHEVIQDRRLSDPKAIAIHAWDGVLTYTQLDEQANRLSNHLRIWLSRNVADRSTSPAVIPLCFERSCFAVISVLAVLKAGCAYVALDTNSPDQRLVDMCDQIGAKLTLCGSSQCKRLAKIPMPALTVDEDLIASLESLGGLEAPFGSLGPNETPGSPALVVFTSGSTGRPKPILISHRAVCSRARDFGPRMNFSASSRVLQNAAYAFDIHACEIFFTLIFGGTLFLINEDKSRLAEIVSQWNINWLFMTPSATETIEGAEAIPSVRTLVMAGEAPNRDQIARLKAGAIHLINAYGPAENTFFTSMNVITSQNTDPREIGPGINTRTWITHPEDVNKLMPIGATGELLLEGPSLSDGYLNRPSETAQAFIQCPSWATLRTGKFGLNHEQSPCGRILYRTGDLVHYLPDGSLRIVGRVGSQVKLRGQRLELEEVEHHLRQVMSQEVLAVELFTTPRGRQCLAAILPVCNLILGQEKTPIVPLSQDVRKIFASASTSLADRLPAFMIPSLYIPVHCLPRTLSGKLDRKALKAVLECMSNDDIQALALGEHQKIKPQTSEEKLLQGIWAKVLSIPTEEIGLDDSFFSLGGDSILAIRLSCSVALCDSDLRLAVNDVLLKPRLRDMAICIKTTGIATKRNLQPFAMIEPDTEHILHLVGQELKVDVAEIQDIYPCSALQEGFFSMSMQAPGAYVARHTFQLPPDIEKDRFCQIWSQTVSELDILRTRIAMSPSGRLMQVVLSSSVTYASNLKVYEDTADQELLCIALGSELHSAFIQKPSVESEALHFVWEASHIIFDGWSIALLINHLESLYFGKSPRPVNSYKNFINYIETSDQPAAKSFWEARLSNCHAPKFPPDLIDGQVSARKVFRSTFPLPSFSHRAITVPTLLEAAWAFVLAQKHSMEDIVYAMTLSGRNAPVEAIDAVVGPTICTVPKRTQIRSEDTVLSLLEQVRTANLQIMPYEQMGFQNILRLFPSGEDLKSRNILVIQTSRAEQSSLFEELDTASTADFNTYPLLLELLVIDSKDSHTQMVNVECSFDSTVIGEWEIENLMPQLFNVVHQMADLTRKLSEINIGLVEKENSILRTASEVLPVNDGRMDDLLQAQFRCHMEEAAICDEAGSMTYEDLQAAALTLSSYIMDSKKSKSGTSIALCFRQSRWSVIASIAGLFAGVTCVYLHPDDCLSTHLETMIRSDVGLVLSEVSFALSFRQHACVLVVNESILANLARNRSGADRSTFSEQADISFQFVNAPDWDRGSSILSVSHRELYTWYQRMRHSLPYTKQDRVLLAAGNGVLRDFLDILCTFAAGGCICIGPQQPIPSEIENSITKMNVTMLTRPPSRTRHLSLARCLTLKTIILYGEMPRQDDLQSLQFGVSLFSVYCPDVWPLGLSVVHIGVDSTLENLGRIQALSTLIVDNSSPSRSSPLGWVGKLCLNEDVANSSSCGPRPTGDQVKLNSDQSVTFVNSTAAPAYLDGCLVPLSRVESTALKRIHQMVDCKVEICHLTAMQRDFLVLFIDLNSDSKKPGALELRSRQLKLINPAIPRLKQALLQSLPHFMVPNIYLPLASMPRTYNGCVDRKALRTLAETLSEETINIFNPKETHLGHFETDQEQLMASLWAQVLNLEISSLTADSQWMSLGGDSILAMRLVALAKSSGLIITVADVLFLRTLSGLAAAARSPESSSAFEDQPTRSIRLSKLKESPSLLHEVQRYTQCTEVEIEDIGETTDFQNTMFCSGMLAEGGWNNHVCVDLAPNTDVDSIEQACTSLLATTPILRTAFIPFRGSLMQVVLPGGRLELQHHVSTDIAASTMQWITQDRARPSSLTTALARGTIISHTGHATRLILGISHMQYDGISLPIFCKQLHQAIVGQSLIAAPTTFIDYVQIANASFTTEAQSYWRDLLKQSNPTDIVLHRIPIYQHPMASMCMREITLQKSRSQKFTLATVVKTAWAYVLSNWASTDDVTFGTLVSGRHFSDQDLSTVVGPCLNLLPVRIRTATSGNAPQDLLQQVHDQHLATLPFEGVGYNRLITSCTDWAPWTRFSSIVHHQHLDQEDQRVRLIAAENDSADLWIVTEPRAGGSTLMLELMYSDQVFSAETIAALSSCLCETLEALLNLAPQSPHLPIQSSLFASLPALPIQPDELHPSKVQTSHVVDNASAPGAYQESERSIHEFVCEAWRSVGLDPTEGPNKPFYEKSGSILAAVELAGVYERMLNTTVLVDDLVIAGTVQEQVNLLLRCSFSAQI